jgi:hypothetical protein
MIVQHAHAAKMVRHRALVAQMIALRVRVETATDRLAHVASTIVRQVVVGRPSVVQVKIAVVQLKVAVVRVRVVVVRVRVVVVRVRDAAVLQKVAVAQVPADRVKVAAEHFAMMIVQ